MHLPLILLLVLPLVIDLVGTDREVGVGVVHDADGLAVWRSHRVRHHPLHVGEDGVDVLVGGQVPVGSNELSLHFLLVRI